MRDQRNLAGAKHNPRQDAEVSLRPTCCLEVNLVSPGQSQVVVTHPPGTWDLVPSTQVNLVTILVLVSLGQNQEVVTKSTWYLGPARPGTWDPLYVW